MLKMVPKRLLNTHLLAPKFLSTEPAARGLRHPSRCFSNGGHEAAENQKQKIDTVEVKPKSVWEMPGIPILPLVGSWPFLMFNKDWNYHDLTSFHRACFAKYGRIFRLHNPGGGNQVFISDIRDIQKLFHTPSVALAPQRAHYDALIKVRTEELRRMFQRGGMTFSTGKEWTRVRAVFNQWLLREQHHLEAELTDEVTKEFCDRIIRIRDPVSFQVPCNFIEELMSWSMEALSYALLGLRQRHVAEDIPRDSPAGRVIASRCPSTIALEKTEYRPQLWKYFKTRAYKTLEETSNEALRFNNNLIGTRLNQLEEDPSLRRDTLLEKASAHPDLTDGDVHSSLHNLLAAGMEVTPQHTSKLLYCLAKHTEVQQKLRAEVDSTLGANVPVGEAVTSRMPYLRAVVKESLRFLPTASVTNRILSEPVVLSNYCIPAGWSVAVPMMLLGLDEKNVRRSNEFIPERFMGRDNELAPLPYSYLPFSYGRRQCVGKKIAEVMMRNLAARVVQKFEIEYNHGDLSQASHITLQLKGPLNFTFRDRSLASPDVAATINKWASLA